MSLPAFEKNGTLPTGIHICSGTDFIEKFCSFEDRKDFRKPISDILDFATSRGATHIFVGGSFVTYTETPEDFDCVIVFNKAEYIPSQLEKVVIAELKFDILYASLDNPFLIDCYIKLFSTGRFGGQVGVIQIDLYDEQDVWEIKHEPDNATFEIIKKVYNHRAVIDLNEKRGVLVSIHGLLSKGEWNAEIAPIVSSQDWIFAPYIYDTNSPTLLFNAEKRNAVLENFRKWIYDLSCRYDSEISIVAHSFGTFLIGAYLSGFEIGKRSPVTFNSIILTGSILSKDFDWNSFKSMSVGRIFNMIAPNDEWVKFMPENLLRGFFEMSNLFGKSGKEGFSIPSSILSQSTNEIFTHTNTIKRDIIETMWMPFLNGNKRALYNDVLLEMENRYKPK